MAWGRVAAVNCICYGPFFGLGSEALGTVVEGSSASYR
jgi:hypothetical protein